MSKRKAPSSDGNVNSDFSDFLHELANYERNVNRNVYKYDAYRKAASSIAAHPTRITSGKDARKLDGVGEKIASKIEEFIATGTLQKLEKINSDDTSKSINLLTRVTGIGPAKAKELFDSGIKTLEDLNNNKHKLNHHQIIGLKYFEDFEKKVPREEIQRIEIQLKRTVLELNEDYVITICGSYRRGKPESGDIDVLIAHPLHVSKALPPKSCFSNNELRFKPSQFLENVVKALQNDGLIIDQISLGDIKFMGVCKIDDTARRLDIRLTPIDQFYCATLYFTGSDLFNKNMRGHALQKGFTLNEYALRYIGCTGVPGNPVTITSEEDIFDCIDYPYKNPFERSI